MKGWCCAKSLTQPVGGMARQPDGALGEGWGRDAAFRPPVRVKASTETFNATHWGPRCPSDSVIDPSVPEDEDCLNLNIFRPRVRDQSSYQSWYISIAVLSILVLQKWLLYRLWLLGPRAFDWHQLQLSPWGVGILAA
jgi:Carboxylesterase family